MLPGIRRLTTRLQPFLTLRRLVIGLVLIVCAGAVVWMFRVSGTLLGPEVVREAAVALGPFGPLALIVALACLLVAPVMPAALLQIGAGLAFGPVVGLLCTVLADVLGASLGFWIARRWGRALIAPRLSPATQAQVECLAQRVSWRSVMVLRLLPGPAYPLVSFAAGYSELGFGAYTLASLAGALPALALLAFAGDLVTRSPLLAFSLVALLVGGLALVGRWWGRRTGEALNVER
ncbi:MAG: TVP38/TMEM64 family protein [Chloroflexi bacterium]|nr:TVP38/TMEM64 family protein [Chloroflexota bacterium]